jgi:spermidine/putrescine transport system ATP-binding protein
VTHDQEEALSMSDTICIMLEGRIVQTGGPRELYDEPVNHYVAGFVGKSNFFAGTVVESHNEGAAIRLASGRILKGRVSPGATVPNRDQEAKLAVRPELVHIAAVNGKAVFSTDVETPARVKNRIFLGEQTEYLVETDDLGDILIRASKHAEGISGGFSPGDAVTVGWDDASALAFEEIFDQGRSPVGAASTNDDDGTANKGDYDNDQETR